MTADAPVQHDTEGKQFYISAVGGRAYLAYMDLGKQTMDIYRTYVPDALRGRGLAEKLAVEALKYAEEQGYTVIPSCSYFEYFMQRQRSSH